jgi:hypothetical protein
MGAPGASGLARISRGTEPMPVERRGFLKAGAAPLWVFTTCYRLFGLAVPGTFVLAPP